MPNRQDFSLMNAHARIEVMTRAIAPVGKGADLTVRTGETDFLASVRGLIKERTASNRRIILPERLLYPISSKNGHMNCLYD